MRTSVFINELCDTSYGLSRRAKPSKNSVFSGDSFALTITRSNPMRPPERGAEGRNCHVQMPKQLLTCNQTYTYADPLQFDLQTDHGGHS